MTAVALCCGLCDHAALQACCDGTDALSLPGVHTSMLAAAHARGKGCSRPCCSLKPPGQRRR